MNENLNGKKANAVDYTYDISFANYNQNINNNLIKVNVKQNTETEQKSDRKNLKDEKKGKEDSDTNKVQKKNLKIFYVIK